MKRTVLSLALAATAALLACGVAYAAVAVSFAPAKSYPAGGAALAVSAADLDGDRDADVATANGASGTVSVLVRRADGTFRAPREYPSGGDYATDVIAKADFDGDGDRDLAASNGGSSDDISVRLGRGDGTFGAQRRYSAGAGTRPQALVSGDLDGDGDTDIATANGGGGHGPKPNWSILGTVSVFENAGDGTFAAARSFPVGEAYEPDGLDMDDLDGDGDEDLVVALMTTVAGDGGLAVLMNGGEGSFGAPQRYEDGNSAKAVIANDLDGDGDSDLATVDGSVVVLENGGDGAFTYQGDYRVGPDTSTGEGAGARPGDLVEADFDRDGDLDIATANPDSDNVSVLENAGDGTLGKPRVFGAGDYPAAITRARMNPDRKPDLIVGNFLSEDVSVLRNTTR